MSNSSPQFTSACVIGWPIAHSRSPLIHGYWLKKYGISGVYAREAVAPENLSQFIQNMQKNGYVGANITVPHKEAVFHLVQKPDAHAQRLGAVNTLWFENGVLCGTNSDGIGFLKSLDYQTPGWDQNIETVLVYGAGGAALAIIDAILSRGAGRIIISNRSSENAQALADKFGVKVSICTNEADLKAAYQAVGLIVNTTSLGLDGVSTPASYFELCPSETIVTDIVYTPLETPFLKLAMEHGLVTAHGLDMLLFQATVGFEKWFGIAPDVDNELRAHLLENMSILV